jgi:SAM-dependent methyltransferase
VNRGVHPAAAEGFEREAEAYERGRPSYPAAATSFLIRTLDIGPGRVVADVAAGTGKLTAALAATGADTIAIEPVASMRAVLARSLPSARVIDGTAERSGLADSSLDAACVAQAFHWFDGALAVAEFARVLRPGGRLGIVFNVRDESDPIQAGLELIWEPHRGDTPTHRFGAWRQAFDGTATFTPLVLRSFPNEQHVTIDELVDRVVSVSFIATLDARERARVADQVRELAGDRSTITLRYRTDVFWTERISGRRAP